MGMSVQELITRGRLELDVLVGFLLLKNGFSGLKIYTDDGFIARTRKKILKHINWVLLE